MVAVQRDQLDVAGEDRRVGVRGIDHHVLHRVLRVVAPERRDAPHGVLRPSLHHPVHREPERRRLLQHRRHVVRRDTRLSLDFDRRQLEAVGRVLDLEPELPDAVAQRVGGGEVFGSAALVALLRQAVRLVTH